MSRERNTILLLEDNRDRIRDFEIAVRSLGPGFNLKLWHDAPTMIAECPQFFASAALISLDHDLNPMSDGLPDPGTGLEVAQFLARHKPVCPVIIHTSNHERRWSMHNEFRFAGWNSVIALSFNDDWIRTSWIKIVKELVHTP